MAITYTILWNTNGQSMLTDPERDIAEATAQSGTLVAGDIGRVFLSGVGGTLYADSATPPNLWVHADRTILVGSAVVGPEQVPGEGDLVPQGGKSTVVASNN